MQGEAGSLTRTNTVVMNNKQLEWDKPDTHTAMLDRSPCGSGEDIHGIT